MYNEGRCESNYDVKQHSRLALNIGKYICRLSHCIALGLFADHITCPSPHNTGLLRHLCAAVVSG